MKATVVQNDTRDLIKLKKKLKMKKKRLKEEVRLWEESRRCSDGQNDEPEAAKPPSKKSTTENDKISKPSAGMWAWTCMHIQYIQKKVHSYNAKSSENVWSCCHANTGYTIPYYTHWSYLTKIILHHRSLSVFHFSDRSFHKYTMSTWLIRFWECCI